jgi:hypothetical protein
MERQLKDLFPEPEDELLEQQLEGLFAESTTTDPAETPTQHVATLAADPGRHSQIPATSHAPGAGGLKPLLKPARPMGLKRVLVALFILLICVVLAGLSLARGSQAPPVNEAAGHTRLPAGVTAGDLATATPTARATPHRITVAPKQVLPTLLSSARTTSEPDDSTPARPGATLTPPPAAATSAGTAVSTPAGQPPAPPSSLHAVAVGFTRVRLDWQDNASNESGYVLRGGAKYFTVEADASSHTAEGLQAETEYCYMILAFNDDGASDWSNWACATTPQMFTARPAFGFGNSSDLAWGDFDDDGDLDLAVANDGEPNRLYVNQGDRFYQTAQFGAGRTWSLAWGDYDNDGDLDLAAGNGYGSAQNHLFINDGGGAFISRDAFNAASTEALAWGDFDADGDLDLAVGNEYSQQNYLYVNDGTGTFSQSAQFGISVTHAVAWGDSDQDGDLDLAVGNQGQNMLFLNHNGLFSPTLAFGSGDTKSVAWGDCDQDGDLDLAVGNSGSQQNYLYLNKGDGSFSESAQFGTGHTYAVAWGDYDGDGDLDLAVGNFRDEQNYLFTNHGAGTWGQRAEFGAGSTTSMAWGDYDGDGDLDLALGNAFGQQNTLFVNQYTTP